MIFLLLLLLLLLSVWFFTLFLSFIYFVIHTDSEAIMDIYLRNLIRLASAAPESASSAASSPPASPHSTAAAAHGPEAAAAVEAHVWHSIVATSHHRRVHLMAPEVHTDIDSRTDRPDREYAGQSLEIQYSTARLQTMTDIGRRTHTHTHRERERELGREGIFFIVPSSLGSSFVLGLG